MSTMGPEELIVVSKTIGLLPIEFLPKILLKCNELKNLNVEFVGDEVNKYDDFHLRNLSRSVKEKELISYKYDHLQLRRRMILKIKTAEDIVKQHGLVIDYSITHSDVFDGTKTIRIKEGGKRVGSFLNTVTPAIVPEKSVTVFDKNLTVNLERSWLRVRGYRCAQVGWSDEMIKDIKLKFNPDVLNLMQKNVTSMTDSINNLREIVENKNNRYNKTEKSVLNYEVEKSIHRVIKALRKLKKE